MLARYARNRRLADACYLWAFAALTASPGARAFYDQRRAAGDTHHRALRALANRLVGILHGCLRHGTLYDEHTAWGHRTELAAWASPRLCSTSPKAPTGFPVFQSTPEKGIGIAYMLGSTGGYLAGFLVMAAIVGWAVDRGWGRSIVKIFAAMLVAEIVMMAMGFSWLAALIGAEKSWQFGVVPFIVPDLIKVALAAALTVAATGVISGLGKTSR